MKRMPLVLATLAILSIFLISPVAAANNQGLSWAIASADRFDFTVKTDIPGEDNINEGLYYVVQNNPATIPDSISMWSQIPAITVKLYWTNGSLASLGLIGADKLAVPIGNWTLLSSLAEDLAFPGYEDVNDAAYWGYKARTAFFLPSIQLRLEVKWLKSDGFLSLIDATFWNTTSDSEYGSFTLTRQGGDILSLIMDNILYVGIGVGVIIILGAVVCLRRK